MDNRLCVQSISAYILYNYIVLPSTDFYCLVIIFYAGHEVVHKQSNPPKQLKKFNNVAEIFHNIKLTNSNSKMSNKLSEVDGANNKYEKKLHVPETIDRKNQKGLVSSPKDKCISERVNYKYQSDKKNEQAHCLQTLNCQNNLG